MKLIVNADDLGFTRSINDSIVQCFSFGIVKSTTLMVNQQATEHAVSLIHEGLIPEVGLHLNLTAGKPILPTSLVPDLVDQNGYFLAKHNFKAKVKIDEQQIYNEFEAQYKKSIKLRHRYKSF